MRRILMFVTVMLLTFQAAATEDFRSLMRRGGEGTAPGAPWATLAKSADKDTVSPNALSFTTPAIQNRPIVLLETNYYTYLPADRLQLRVTTNANGYTGAVTMYLYNENRTTGARQYYSIAGGGLQPATSRARDLFGASTTPVQIVVPELEDFVLLGTSSDPSELSFGAINGALEGSIAVPSGQSGLYQWVIEIRDAAGREVLARSNAMYSYIEASVNVSGTITSNTTWTANNRYVLSDFVGVVEPAVLTIEPGTVIYGGNGRATLFIQRGAKIMADGTARRPIIFTSPQVVGSRAQTDWGSLVVLGKAPINETGGQAVLEGLGSQPQYTFGGTGPNDSSGVLRYIRLEFGGFAIEANQEINGLTLAGVGRGTVVDYIQVLHNKDDAFEFFGGTVNAKHLLGIAFADDGLDFDLGYVGKIQFAAMIKRAANDENDANFLTEADNHPNNFSLTPLTVPTVYNATAVRVSSGLGNYGAVLRRGVSTRFYNTIVANSRHAPLTLRDDATFTNVSSGSLVFDNSILFGDFADARFPSSSDRAASTRTFLFTTMANNRNVDPLLAMGTPTELKTLMPDLTPLPGSPARDASFVAQPPDDGFFEQVDFIGAVGPNHDWILTGWARFADN